MSLSMSQASAPVFLRFLENLSVVLKKGEEFAQARKLEDSHLVDARLYPDMFPLVKQVQIACDFAKGCTARLAGIDIPKFADDETSLAQLQARIAKTRDFIQSVDASKLDGSEEKNIQMSVGPYDLEFKGQEYLLNFALPNFYFHITTAYAILRHVGVNVGKMDFVGSIEQNMRNKAA